MRNNIVRIGVLGVVAVALFAVGCAGKREFVQASSHEYGIFFGTGAHPKKMEQQVNEPFGAGDGTAPTIIKLKDDNSRIATIAKPGALINPFTNQPYPEDTLFIAPGHTNGFKEAYRAIVATLFGAVSLKKYKELEGRHFKYMICHSNGSTEAITAHKRGLIKVDHFIHLGSPWSSFGEQEIEGASQLHVKSYGDPVVLLGVVRVPYYVATLPARRYDQAASRLNLRDESPSLVASASSAIGGFDDSSVAALNLSGFVDQHFLTTSYYPSIAIWANERGKFSQDPQQMPRSKPRKWDFLGLTDLFSGKTYDFSEFYPVDLRATLPELFPDTIEHSGHLIQRGLFEEGEKDLKRLWYVNVKGEIGNFDEDGFSSVQEAKQSIK